MKSSPIENPAPHIRIHRFEISNYRPAVNPEIWSDGNQQLHLHVFHFPRVGDIDHDEKLELIYSKGCSEQTAYNVDGMLRWRYHMPGLTTFEHTREDSLVPIFDLDGDGRAEVGAFRLINGVTHLCLLDAATGHLLRSTPLTPNPMTSDTRMSLVPARLDGPGNPFSLILSRDYWRVEAYDHLLRPRWNVAIGAMGHTALVDDFDGDGFDEIFTGTRLIRSDGTTAWDRPDLLDGTGETHPDSMVAADVDGDGKMEFAIATGALLVDLQGNVRWRQPQKVHHGQAVRLLQTARGPRFAFVDQRRYDMKEATLKWRGRTIRDVTSICHVLDGGGRSVGEFQMVHTPQVGDWDGDGDDEIFALAPDRRHIHIHRADGSLVDRLPVADRAYVSDMVVAPVLPQARGTQLIIHEWNDDESRTDCLIFENTAAGANARRVDALALARQTCY